MNITRPFVLASALFALVISACSQPEDFTTPTLEPQFGTDEADIGFDVSVTSNGRVSVLWEETGAEYDGEDSWYDFHYEQLNLRFYDTSGNFVSGPSAHAAEDSCNSGCYDNDLRPRALYVDAKGFKYALYSSSSNSYGYSDGVYVYHRIIKLDASGEWVGYAPYELGRGSTDVTKSGIDAAVDGNGNIYVAKAEYTHDYNTGTGFYTNVVAKYSTAGILQWQRTSTVGTPYGITVSGSGSVYVVGSKGLARYSNSGGLTWTKSAIGEDVIVSGSYVYTRYRRDIRKFDGTGKQLWLKTQSGLDTMVFQDMVGDGNGNVYLSGKYDADLSSGRNMNAMVRKLSPSSSALWTKTYGTPAYDDARGIATLSGSEIYVTGETQGSLAHPNRGGDDNRDAYVRKLNSSGSPVWTR